MKPRRQNSYSFVVAKNRLQSILQAIVFELKIDPYGCVHNDIGFSLSSIFVSGFKLIFHKGSFINHVDMVGGRGVCPIFIILDMPYLVKMALEVMKFHKKPNIDVQSKTVFVSLDSI